MTVISPMVVWAVLVCAVFGARGERFLVAVWTSAVFSIAAIVQALLSFADAGLISRLDPARLISVPVAFVVMQLLLTELFICGAAFLIGIGLRTIFLKIFARA